MAATTRRSSPPDRPQPILLSRSSEHQLSMLHRPRCQHVKLALSRSSDRQHSLDRSSDRQHSLQRLRYQHVLLAPGRPPGRQHPLLIPAVVNFRPHPLKRRHAQHMTGTDRQRHRRQRKPGLRVVCRKLVQRYRCRLHRQRRNSSACQKTNFARLSLRGGGPIFWKLEGPAHDNDRSTTIGGRSKP